MSRGRCLEKNEPKENILEDIMFWKPLVSEFLQCIKEPTNEVDKNAVAVIRSNSQCKEGVVCHMQQKFP